MAVSRSAAALAFDAATLTISGAGFDAASPQANVVVLGNGLSPGAVVVAATATQLTVSLPASSPTPTPARSTGPLTAVVTVASRGSGGVSSGAPVEVATVLLPLLNWRGAGASGDGSRLFLAANANGTVWRSLDGGVSFSPTTAPIRNWQVRFSSSSSSFFFFCFFFFHLLVSHLLITPNPTPPPPSTTKKQTNKKSVSADATGTNVAAAAYGDAL